MSVLAMSASALSMSKWIRPEANLNTPRIIIAANDQRFTLTDGLGQVKENPGEGSLTLLDFSAFPPKVSHIENVPCSVIGPPTCVAVTPDESLAIVASAMKVDPDDSTRQVFDNRVSLVDLRSDKPGVIQQIEVGEQPSGVSISACGGFALVSNRQAGTVSLLAIKDRRLSVIDTCKIAEPGDGISDVAIWPDGKNAVASITEKNVLAVLQITADKLMDTGQRIETGVGPYKVEVASQGNRVIAANVGGHDNRIVVLDATDRNNLKVIDRIFVGITPEDVTLSLNGEYAAVNCLQHTHAKPTDAHRQQHGQVVLMRRQGDSFRICDRIQVNRIPQASVFSPDGKYLLVSSFEEKNITVYQISEDDRLEPTDIVIDLPGQPAALSRITKHLRLK